MISKYKTGKHFEVTITDTSLTVARPQDRIEHLATLPRNQVRFAGATADVPMLTEPTSTQREAFDLIGVPIPLTLK